MLVLLACHTPSPDPSDTAEARDTAETEPSGPIRAVWVWSPPWEAPGPFVAQVVEGGFNSVYLADYTPEASHHALIEALHAADVSVTALAGDPSWAVDADPAVAHAEAIAAFDADGEPYDALQHDTEFYILDAWAGDPAGTLDAYVAMLDAVRAVGGPPLQVALPVWLDPADYAQIRAHCDSVALMDYRDTVARIEADAAEELAEDTPVTIGLELMEDPEGDPVSFHEEGKDALLAAIAQVEADSAGLPGFAGIAVHEWEAWVEGR